MPPPADDQGSVICGAMAFPYFVTAGTTNPFLVVVATAPMIDVAHAGVFAPPSAFFAEQFDAGVRHSGTSAGFQLAPCSPAAAGRG